MYSAVFVVVFLCLIGGQSYGVPESHFPYVAPMNQGEQLYHQPTNMNIPQPGVAPVNYNGHHDQTNGPINGNGSGLKHNLKRLLSSNNHNNVNYDYRVMSDQQILKSLCAKLGETACNAFVRIAMERYSTEAAKIVNLVRNSPPGASVYSTIGNEFQNKIFKELVKRKAGNGRLGKVLDLYKNNNHHNNQHNNLHNNHGFGTNNYQMNNNDYHNQQQYQHQQPMFNNPQVVPPYQVPNHQTNMYHNQQQPYTH